jgi:hypothetical protein
MLKEITFPTIKRKREKIIDLGVELLHLMCLIQRDQQKKTSLSLSRTLGADILYVLTERKQFLLLSYDPVTSTNSLVTKAKGSVLKIMSGKV